MTLSAKSFSKWLDANRTSLPSHIVSLADRAALSLAQMELDPRSNEQCPNLKASNIADIKAFHDAMSATGEARQF